MIGARGALARVPQGPMRAPIRSCAAFFSVLAWGASAHAATMYVSPTGTATSGCATRATPCSLASAAMTAVAGDTVVLMDGVYRERLVVANSGTASSWITFEADQCATPIIEGTGVGPTDDNQDTGVGSATATYVRFVGLVSRGWNTGFGNGWTGAGTTNSNGHWEIKNCIADGNGRTGFTFFSAQGIRIVNSISAHNGSSTAHSWSSGVTLYEAGGTNSVEGTVSFENMDAERNTDGSGFIVDEHSNGATFINNLAFGNGGSCFRLTKSSGTRFINNTCYHDAQNSRATGPTNPGEIYFTDAESRMSVSVLNNVFVATGTGPGANPVFGKPTSGYSNNIETTGAASFFTSPDGTNPTFTLAASASTLIGRGTTGTGVPTNDIGFDPRCIVKRTPTLVGMIARGSWWQYSVDIDYIKGLGGVAKCFNPGTRSGTPDIGAYKSGSVTTSAGMCVPPTSGMGGAGGMGGSASAGAAGRGMGGSPSMGGAANPGGAPNSGGATNVGGANLGGTFPTAGDSGLGGASAGSAGAGVAGTAGAPGGSAAGGVAGAPPSGAGTGPSTGGVAATGGAPGTAGSSTAGGVPGGGDPSSDDDSAAGETPAGCGCRTLATGPANDVQPLTLLGLLGLGVLRALRRRR